MESFRKGSRALEATGIGIDGDYAGFVGVPALRMLLV